MRMYRYWHSVWEGWMYLDGRRYRSISWHDAVFPLTPFFCLPNRVNVTKVRLFKAGICVFMSVFIPVFCKQHCPCRSTSLLPQLRTHQQPQSDLKKQHNSLKAKPIFHLETLSGILPLRALLNLSRFVNDSINRRM